MALRILAVTDGEAAFGHGPPASPSRDWPCCEPIERAAALEMLGVAGRTEVVRLQPPGRRRCRARGSSWPARSPRWPVRCCCRRGATTGTLITRRPAGRPPWRRRLSIPLVRVHRVGRAHRARLLDERVASRQLLRYVPMRPPTARQGAGRSAPSPASSSRAPTAVPSCRPELVERLRTDDEVLMAGRSAGVSDSRRLRTPLPGRPRPVAVRQLAVRAAPLRRDRRLPPAPAVPASLRAGLLGRRAFPAAGRALRRARRLGRRTDGGRGGAERLAGVGQRRSDRRCRSPAIGRRAPSISSCSARSATTSTRRAGRHRRPGRRLARPRRHAASPSTGWVIPPDHVLHGDDVHAALAECPAWITRRVP